MPPPSLEKLNYYQWHYLTIMLPAGITLLFKKSKDIGLILLQLTVNLGFDLNKFRLSNKNTDFEY